ncbi:uncharacterized protein VP01_344g12 [Puccinia sorghi]|uniref:Uncharacterized protein n=1 Tax=Puccinia sorghi TaxID=27349 RepID=A0A0L6UW84_9BASI|nr:uncharacterized protein VP01_344g12 [Puccinia sorghi]
MDKSPPTHKLVGNAYDRHNFLQDYCYPHFQSQEHIGFTQDTWATPNMTAFMALTAYFINEMYELQDLTQQIPNG